MKQKFFILAFLTFLLAGCLDTTQEVTIHEDGSGVLKNTNDMSAMIGFLKQMGSNDAVSKLGGQTIDSTFSLNKLLDSSQLLSAEEKAMAVNGSVYVNADMMAEKFITTMSLPFKTTDDIAALNQVSRKLMQETLDKVVGKMPETGMEEMPKESSLDDYFRVEYRKGLVVRELNKEKYAAVASDEYLKAMQEAATMGLTMSTTFIINLPVEAKKVEGKNVKISKDNKQVTVKASIDDFFDDPSKFEFRIEY